MMLDLLPVLAKLINGPNMYDEILARQLKGSRKIFEADLDRRVKSAENRHSRVPAALVRAEQRKATRRLVDEFGGRGEQLELPVSKLQAAQRYARAYPAEIAADIAVADTADQARNRERDQGAS
jgi:hypothetical protein